MYGNIAWLEPWYCLCTEGSSFEQELYKELGKNHVLNNKKVSVIGRRYDRDDFLFEINDIEFKLAVVHLTFSGKDESGTYPKTKLYKDLDDWINRCMLPDHTEFE
ncbi:hypothetical protein [Clostridium intestinale]|uniref:Uncharacterized protein n=1 Tax=Clostridium intestinale TaxID=36845 RepID=A0A7D6VXA7_9CLOT|nr:hypothetical protein [Clostridium intestinale]QLY77851.1 hypothetical protein HZF06_12095 [Clostridium intestinale]